MPSFIYDVLISDLNLMRKRKGTVLHKYYNVFVRIIVVFSQRHKMIQNAARTGNSTQWRLVKKKLTSLNILLYQPPICLAVHKWKLSYVLRQ